MKSYTRILSVISVTIASLEPAWSMEAGKRTRDEADKFLTQKKQKTPHNEKKQKTLHNVVIDLDKENISPQPKLTNLGEEYFKLAMSFLREDNGLVGLHDVLQLLHMAKEATQKEAIVIVSTIQKPNFQNARFIQQKLGEGFFELASRYQHGGFYNYPQDVGKAQSYYRFAAQFGHAYAQLELALILKDMGTLMQLEEAFFWCDAAAQQNVPHAQYILGLCYTKGLGVPQDFMWALNWFFQAALNNHEEGKVIKGTSKYIPVDSIRAKELLGKGLFSLGDLYMTGNNSNFPQNAGKAISFFKDSAEFGYASARIRLDLLTSSRLPGLTELGLLEITEPCGSLEEISDETPIELPPIKKSAQELFQLGCETKDPEKAIRYFLKAHQRHDTDFLKIHDNYDVAKIIVTAASQRPLLSYKECLAEGYFGLAYVFEKRTDLEKNFYKACVFYRKAMNLDHEQAICRHHNLQELMYPAAFVNPRPTPQPIPQVLNQRGDESSTQVNSRTPFVQLNSARRIGKSPQVQDNLEELSQEIRKLTACSLRQRNGTSPRRTNLHKSKVLPTTLPEAHLQRPIKVSYFVSENPISGLTSLCDLDSQPQPRGPSTFGIYTSTPTSNNGARNFIYEFAL